MARKREAVTDTTPVDEAAWARGRARMDAAREGAVRFRMLGWDRNCDRPSECEAADRCLARAEVA
jgi:hypothetical protein